MLKEKILVTQEVRKWLEETFGVRREMVSAALNYRSNTELAQKIRTLALKKGGSTSLTKRWRRSTMPTDR